MFQKNHLPSQAELLTKPKSHLRYTELARRLTAAPCLYVWRPQHARKPASSGGRERFCSYLTQVLTKLTTAFCSIYRRSVTLRPQVTPTCGKAHHLRLPRAPGKGTHTGGSLNVQPIQLTHTKCLRQPSRALPVFTELTTWQHDTSPGMTA